MSTSTGLFAEYNQCFCPKFHRNIQCDSLAFPCRIPETARIAKFTISNKNMIRKINQNLVYVIEMVKVYIEANRLSRPGLYKKNINPMKKFDNAFAGVFNKKNVSESDLDAIHNKLFYVYGSRYKMNIEYKNYYVKQEVTIYETDDGIYTSVTICQLGRFVMSYHPKHLKYLRKFKISNQEMFYYSLRVFVMRVNSHMNFSINHFRELILSGNYADYGIIECFASPWNCQNYLVKQDAVDITYGLDPDWNLGILGTFPNNLHKDVKYLMNKYGKVLLIANPVFTEKNIINMFSDFEKFLSEFELSGTLEIQISVPWWQDLYESSKIMRPLRSIRRKYSVERILHNNFEVASFNESRNLSLKWYQVVIKNL